MANERILVVDDNPTNLKLVQVVLSTSGFEVCTAVDGQDALAQVEACQPRLILTDLQMPVMDGLELTRQLKADERTRWIPVVALTSYAMKGDEEKALAAGCSGYITKPVDTRSLPDLVAGYLREAEHLGGAP